VDVKVMLAGVLPFLRRSAFVVHQWAGIAVCLLFVAWFISGVVLAYQPFPALSRGERLAHLAEIDFAAVRIDPDAALLAAGQSTFPSALSLETRNGEPVYRIVGWEGDRHTISAVTGQPTGPVSAEKALELVGAFAPRAELAQSNVLVDQWTINAEDWEGVRPFYIIRAGDEARTEYYVSSITGEVVLDTNARERFWAYLGAIPHWFYFRGLREHYNLYLLVVEIFSIIGIAVALTGLWLGFTKLRPSNLARKRRITPFNGWKKWHHLIGVVGGIVLCTWMISGFLVVRPVGIINQRSMTQAERFGFAGVSTPSFPANFEALASSQAVAVEFRWIGGRPIAELVSVEGRPRVVDPTTGLVAAITDEEIFAAAAQLMPQHRMTAAERLVEGDEYWHSASAARRPLPILRVKFDDDLRTWFHIDPMRMRVVGPMDQKGRAFRWLFDLLHDFDLQLLLKNRPAWDILIWILSLAGLAISISGVVLAQQRLVQELKK
jgi:uncharacterized iron-regulated membrane protein